MIIGRKRELKLLEKIYQSKMAEFVTIYGRRRVGKTYLIRQFFANNECLYFEAVGSQDRRMHNQLENFAHALSETFFNKTPIKTPRSWKEAFDLLHNQITLIGTQKKVVIFLDELPWMATRKSSLLAAIDYYWNRYWSTMPQIIFIACGSSASWLIKKIIYNKGGLHNRTTLTLEITAFNLTETKAFLQHKGINLTNEHILNIYMALGGIPYYLNYVQKGITAQQNIQQLLFDKKALLKGEFDMLFDSLFDGAEAYKELVFLIGQKTSGLTRKVLREHAKLSPGGGRLSQRLRDLCNTGFVERFVPWSRSLGEFYKLSDEFCLFYMHWLYRKSDSPFTHDYWIKESQLPAYHAWAGYAFEAVCFKHIDQIIAGLGITSAHSYGSWQFIHKIKKDGDGAQIDLVIERFDNAITLCEIKYTRQPFVIDKAYATHINKTVAIFKSKTKAKKQLFFALVSVNGIRPTMYSEEMLTGVVTLDDLFKD